MGSVTDEDILSKPLVTVITVTRNAISDLRITLNSVLTQNYPNVQFLVIDGRSTDGSIKLLEAQGEKIEYISEADKGVYDAMNKGVDRARGRWMIFMNAGDRFSTSDALQTFIDHTADNISLVYSDYLRPTSCNPDQLEVYRSPPLVNQIGIVRMICHQAILFNVAHFPGHYNCNLKLCADLDILLNIRKKQYGTFCHVKRPLVVYKGGGISESDYRTLHKEREIIINRYFSGLITILNRINHVRIRLLHEADQ